MKRFPSFSSPFAVILIAFLVLAGACKKNPKEDAGPDGDGILREIPADMKPLVTPKPASIGDAVTKVIGAAGGTLSSEDGDIAIVVPAGAVSTATTFSIRPVENTLTPGSQTKTSYELLPHSVTFAKPITIIMNYDMDAYENTADGLQVAFREESTGKWKSLPTTLNKDEGSLTVEKSSFSVFEFFERYRLMSNRDALNAGETAVLAVTTFHSYIPKEETNPKTSEGADELLAPLVPQFDSDGKYYQTIKGPKPKASNWRIVEGPGKLSAHNSDYNRIFTAPSPLTASLAIVEVTLTQIPPIKDTKAPGGVRNGGEVKLLGYI